MDQMETAGARVYVVQPADADLTRTCAADRWWISVAARAFPALATTSKAKRERKAQRLFLNGNAGVATNTPVAVGDRIEYAPPNTARADAAEEGRDGAERSPQQWLLVCQRQGMRLVYENDAFAVVVKPVGIHVKGRGLRTVEYALPALLRGRSAGVNKMARDALPTPHAMHRLDYRVGGLLLVTKTRSAEVALAGQFERHYVVKRYRAILVGRLEPSKLPGLVLSTPPELNNEKHWAFGESATSISDQGAVHFYDAPLQGKRSCTALVVRSVTPSVRYGWLTTVDLWPLTGRWHQLRLHMASLGHPIVGDDLHHNHHEDPSTDDLTLPDVVRGAGLFLHAVGLCFDDPQGNRRSFEIAEPHKFDRFRHFCALNREKQINRERRTSDTKP